jgi:hypothetical protein
LPNAYVITTSLSYDNNGNLTASGTSTFSWDYNNRMTQAATQGSTSTYAYDYAGSRVSQTVGSTTTIYPNKFYSITSTTIGANTYATSTVYVWNGDTLIATIDQPLYNGSATGTASTSYITRGGSYLSSGTVYTTFVAANTHTACGTLCR